MESKIGQALYTCISMQSELLAQDIILENERAMLLPFNHERQAELKEIIYDPEIWTYMGMEMKSKDDFSNYIKSTIQAWEDGICYPFIIVDKRSNRVAGSSRYGYINEASEKCEIGWTWYGKDFQGTGLNHQCKKLLLSYGFEEIGFRRIQLSADAENLRSQRAIEKLGAQKEGFFRNNYIDAKGESRDDVYFSIIREDWEAIKQSHF